MTLYYRFRNFLKKIQPIYFLYSVARNWRLKLLRWRPLYESPGLISGHLAEFREDSCFREAFDTAVNAGHAMSRPDEWTKYIACWAAKQGAFLEGDFMECGVAKGMTSRTIMEYLDFGKLPKKFYLIDTYSGLDERYLTENDKKREFSYPDMYDFVKNAFAGFSNAVIVRGAIPEVLRGGGR